MEFKNVKHIESKMKELQIKMRLLKKKREKFGINAEEEKEQKALLREFYLLNDELIDSRLEEVFFSSLYTTEIRNHIEMIKEYLPWNGGRIIRNQDVDNIMEAIEDLNGQKRKIVFNALEKLHVSLLKKFEEFANGSEDEDLEWIQQVGIFITGNAYSSVFDILYYIDYRYRDLADIIGCELDDLDIDYDD